MRAAITSAKPHLPLDAHRSVLNNGPVSAVASYGGDLSTEAMAEARARAATPHDRRSDAPWRLSRDEPQERQGAEIGSSLNAVADLLMQNNNFRETNNRMPVDMWTIG
jgi:hypothetical protein